MISSLDDWHAPYYDELCKAILQESMPISATEKQEWILHRLVCLACQHREATVIAFQDPARGQEMLSRLWSALTLTRVAPYLPGLAQALHVQRSFTPFEALLWRFAQREPTALSQVRLWQAEIAYRAAAKQETPSKIL